MAKTWGRAVRIAVIALALWAVGAGSGGIVPAAAAGSADRLEGYYYPKITSREVYVSRARTLEDSTRTRRLGFVTGLTQQLTDMPYAPSYAIFAKGDQAHRLIIVAYGDGQFNTVYRARALLASLTELARLTPLFQQLQVEELFTFFDLCKLLGFTSITVSDGRHFAHQIVIR